MALLLLVALVSVVVALVYFWVSKRYSYFDAKGYLHEKPTFPFGNLKGVGREFHIVYKITELYKKFKGRAPAFGVYFFVSPNIVITDLDIVKDVLVRDFEVFHNRGLYFNEKDDPLTCHLFTLEDARWRNMRTKLTPTFTSGKMKMMFNTVVEVSKLMIRQLEETPKLDAIEMRNTLGNFTTDVIGNVAFGLEMSSIKDPESKFRQMGKRLFAQGANFQMKVFFMTTFRELSRKLGLRFLPPEAADFFYNTTKQNVDHRRTNNIERPDVLDLLLKIKDSDGEGLTYNEIAAQCLVFFVAGFETSSSTSSFVLYSLALNPDIQDKTREEIQKVLQKHGGQLTYEAMSDMKYLQMVIDETLRLHGPVFQLFRKATREYKIANSDLIIEKDTLVTIPIYGIHTDPEYYPEPMKFDPERFSDENKRDRHPMAHIPFGEGPRNCIGMRFGLMQSKIALIQLLTRFKFSPSSRTTVPMRFDPSTILLAPPDGMWLKLEKL